MFTPENLHPGEIIGGIIAIGGSLDRTFIKQSGQARIFHFAGDAPELYELHVLVASGPKHDREVIWAYLREGISRREALCRVFDVYDPR